MSTILDQQVFVRPRQVKTLVGLSLPTIYRHAKAGTFPRPVKLPGCARAAAFRSEELRAWIAGTWKAAA
jgi:predicted DNA-binding transcriptional regulator AlpA